MPKNNGTPPKSFPRIPLLWYQRLSDPWTFYENVKKMVWDIRWLLGYVAELEHKAKLRPDSLSKRVRDNLSDLADAMCAVCNTEIGDYTPKDPSERKKDIENIRFWPQNGQKTATGDDEISGNDEKKHENMLKIVKISRESRQKRRKTAGDKLCRKK